jgi:hypothetical protein
VNKSEQMGSSCCATLTLSNTSSYSSLSVKEMGLENCIASEYLETIKQRILEARFTITYHSADAKRFKTTLKRYLIKHAFYSLDEYDQFQ